MTEQEQKILQMVIQQRDGLAGQVHNLMIDKQLLLDELAELKAPQEPPPEDKKEA